MKIENATNLPAPLVAALQNDDYDDGGADISATGLLAPARMKALEVQHAGELSEDAADLARPLIGKATHAYIAKDSPGEFDDKRRLFVRVAGWLVSGQTDHVFVTSAGAEMVGWSPAIHNIRDYKTMSVNEWRRGLREEREQQLNIYAELLRANGFAVDSLGATCIFVDFSPRQARMKTTDYPPASIVDVEIPLWPQEKAQAFILERVLAHQAARRDVESVLCSDEERWARGGEWAVMRPNAKRSTKNFPHDELAAAEALAAEIGGVVESREREYARCEDWCRVGKQGLCSQWNGER